MYFQNFIYDFYTNNIILLLPIWTTDIKISPNHRHRREQQSTCEPKLPTSRRINHGGTEFWLNEDYIESTRKSTEF